MLSVEFSPAAVPRQNADSPRQSQSVKEQSLYGDPFSLDQLIGTGKDTRRNRETNLLRRFEIYQQLKFCRLLHRQIGRLGSL
jgi:hypothetical protein